MSDAELFFQNQLNPLHVCTTVSSDEQNGCYREIPLKSVLYGHWYSHGELQSNRKWSAQSRQHIYWYMMELIVDNPVLPPVGKNIFSEVEGFGGGLMHLIWKCHCTPLRLDCTLCNYAHIKHYHSALWKTVTRQHLILPKLPVFELLFTLSLGKRSKCEKCHLHC